MILDAMLEFFSGKMEDIPSLSKNQDEGQSDRVFGLYQN